MRRSCYFGDSLHRTTSLTRVSPSRGDWGDPPLPEKLAFPHCFAPKSYFLIFTPFLAILSKLSPLTSRIHLGNPANPPFHQDISMSVMSIMQ